MTSAGLRISFFAVLALLFGGMVALEIAGHRFGQRRSAEQPVSGSDGTAAVEAAVYALLGLLVAFTFSGAQDRLNMRRSLNVDEANAVGTAYLRVDLLRPEDQPRVREDLRQYVDSRLAFYDRLFDLQTARGQKAESDRIQAVVWRDVVAACARTGSEQTSLLVLPAVNQLFDLTGARYAALRNHLPLVVFAQLVIIALVCAFFAGLGMSKRTQPSLLHVILFAGVIAVTAFVILNLEFPRVGFTRFYPLDQLLRAQRAIMQ